MNWNIRSKNVKWYYLNKGLKHTYWNIGYNSTNYLKVEEKIPIKIFSFAHEPNIKESSGIPECNNNNHNK